MRRLRGKKNGLRPCTHNNGVYSITDSYFHHFGTSGNQDDGFSSVALIEDANGQIHEVDAWKIRFDDVVNIGDMVKLKTTNGEYMDFTVIEVVGDYITGETEDGGIWTNTISSGDILMYDGLDSEITIEIIE